MRAVRLIAVAFLDRDGTINVKAPEGAYVTTPDAVELLPGAGEAIGRLNAAGVPVVVVTNQRGVALGHMTEADLSAVHRRLDELLAREGARVDRYEHCPHEKDSCACRKPRTLMLERAARSLAVDPADGAMIGDAASDVAAGRAVGATTIRLGIVDHAADHSAADLRSAVEWILDGSVPPGRRRPVTPPTRP